MSLTEEDRVKYTALLNGAEAAYHSLMMGGHVVSFQDQNQEAVRYSAANSADLLRYINWLRDLLGMCPFGIMRPSRPAGVLF